MWYYLLSRKRSKEVRRERRHNWSLAFSLSCVPLPFPCLVFSNTHLRLLNSRWSLLAHFPYPRVPFYPFYSCNYLLQASWLFCFYSWLPFLSNLCQLFAPPSIANRLVFFVWSKALSYFPLTRLYPAVWSSRLLHFVALLSFSIPLFVSPGAYDQ